MQGQEGERVICGVEGSQICVYWAHTCELLGGTKVSAGDIFAGILFGLLAGSSRGFWLGVGLGSLHWINSIRRDYFLVFPSLGFTLAWSLVLVSFVFAMRSSILEIVLMNKTNK